MNEIKNGGAAFPQAKSVGSVSLLEGGMTLRDYFAAKAMQGICSSAFKYIAVEGHESTEAIAMMKNIGIVAYKIADAMIKERSK